MNPESKAGLISQPLLSFPFLVGLIAYLIMVFLSVRRSQKWPLHKSLCWIVGMLLAIVSVAGPLADLAHKDFEMHMVTHLLLGMLAPLLLTLAAPMTLILRTLSVSSARYVTRVLRSRYSQFFTHPVTASIMNVGGLWVLYTTDLYALMNENIWIHIFVHVHVFLAGYLFTISMIYIDPIPHRKSYMYRSIVLILALAAHGILSKFIYAHPPAGVALNEAEKGSVLMYYGGDIIDAIIIFILCWHWYKSRRPRESGLVST
ncbi:cytochrome c oxidase assembly protein [Halobacillus sp. H74]|uniref:cytochrome c oxidase assembly protein n=1 Tax=Halobacillus sp. H74 TaxID=3457436 RepID=UPI003FCE5B4F